MNKCSYSQKWRIQLKHFCCLDLKNEVYPYGLGEDENSCATLKILVTPKIIQKYPCFMYRYSIVLTVTVVTDSRDSEQLVQDKKTVDIKSEPQIVLFFRLLDHYEHIIKLKNKSFQLFVRAEVIVHKIGLEYEDENEFSKINIAQT